MVTGDLIRVSQPTISRIVKRVSKLFCLKLQHFVKFPNYIKRVKENFYPISRFPGIVGAVDGTHIPIQNPGGAYAEVFRNRKKFFSINVQIVCGPDLTIYDIVANRPGSVHDNRIFQASICYSSLKDRDNLEGNVTIQSDDQVKQELVYYKNSGNKYLYIFNHMEFLNTSYFRYKSPPKRNGTEQDVNRLSSLFENLGYKVAVHNNLTYDEIMDKILKVSYDDHKDTSCLCFAFLTHGDKGGELYAADRTYQFQDVTSPLAHGHSSLVGIPKIYFVQACRGKNNDPGRELQLDGGRATVTISSYADFLVLNSSVEDYVSYRNINGSFMIQELCNVIEKYHDKLDILHIITIVQKKVAYEWTTYAPKDKKIHDKKQIPETRHTLTKLFKF